MRPRTRGEPAAGGPTTPRHEAIHLVAARGAVTVRRHPAHSPTNRVATKATRRPQTHGPTPGGLCIPHPLPSHVPNTARRKP